MVQVVQVLLGGHLLVSAPPGTIMGQVVGAGDARGGVVANVLLWMRAGGYHSSGCWRAAAGVVCGLNELRGSQQCGAACQKDPENPKITIVL